tara:strand:+ start:14431 stop:16290 length:1860 start_codon:yes stop_codon:yes gene_type:complete
MPIRIRYQNDTNQECTIRPTPLISVNSNVLKNGAGEAFGVTYTISLTGTLLPDEGSPYALDHVADGQASRTSQKDGRYPFHPTDVTPTEVGPYGAFDGNRSHAGINKPPKQQVPTHNFATAILSKQRALKALFAQDGQRFEITDVREDLPAIICYPRITSISFSEGTYVTRSDYTITLEADVLLHPEQDGMRPDLDGTLIPRGGPNEDRLYPKTTQQGTENNLVVALSGAFIQNYAESWAIELDDSQGEVISPHSELIAPRSYRISHSINATGKTHYRHKESTEDTPNQPEKIPAWESARKFVTSRLNRGAIDNYPNKHTRVGGVEIIGSGTLDLINKYGGYNLVRTENVDEAAGSYSVTENWFLASGTAYENFNMSVSSSNSSPFVQVSIDGSIKGLSSFSPSGTINGGSDATSITGAGSGVPAYENALLKYNQISNSGFFGVGSDVYKRANNMVAVGLNSQPASVNIGANKFTGDLTYSLAFDNRPTNIISGAISEDIQVNDTYPGDVFAVIPVLGRATGPVLQYIGGRTEHRRDISVSLVMDYTKIPYASGRDPMILKKPSVVEPTATQLAHLLKSLSPQQEPGVRKCFISPPSESWSPKAGAYSFNVSFTYELDK